MMSKSKNIGAISEKALLNKSIEFKDGELHIWNIRASIFSNYSFAYLFNVFNSLNLKEGVDAVFWMCYYQAMGAAFVTKQRFGIDKKILENVVGQGEMLGYGKTSIKVADFSKCYFVFETDSSIAKEQVSVFAPAKIPLCHHIRGLLAGTTAFLTNKDMVCVEEKCIGKGDSKCVFIVKERSEFDLKNNDFAFQIPKKLLTPEELGDKRHIKILDEDMSNRRSR